MPIDQQEANCVIEVCCGKDGKQQKALTVVLSRELNIPQNDARHIAVWLVQHFDFAPKGTLYDFKQAIAALARSADYE